MYHSDNNVLFDRGINETTRLISCEVTLYTNSDAATAWDVSALVSTVNTTSELGRKVLLAGAVACEMDVTLTHVDAATKTTLREYMAGGAVAQARWKTTYNGTEYTSVYPGFIVQTLEEDMVSDSVTLHCVDMIAALASVQLSSVPRLAGRTVADLLDWYYLEYNGKTVLFGYGVTRFRNLLLTDIAGADATIREVIDRIALSNGLIARATTTSNVFGTSITFVDINSTTRAVTNVTPITRRSSGEVLAAPQVSVDTSAGTISCTLYRDDGSVMAEELATGLSFISGGGGTDYAAFIADKISGAYTTLNAGDRAYMTHRGNPRMQAGDYAEDANDAGAPLVLCSSVSHFYSGGLDGISERSLDGYEDAGNGNIGDVIEGNNNGVMSLIETQEREIADLRNALNTDSGTASINNIYSYSGGSASVRWQKIGKIVIVDLYDIIMTPSVTTSATCVLASGLPKAKYNSVTVITPNTALELSRRCGINAGSTDIVWWWNYTVSTDTSPMIGQLIYIAE